MKPRLPTAVAAAREGFLSFPVPPPGGRWFDLYRRFAVASLEPDRAERLLREVREGASTAGGTSRA